MSASNNSRRPGTLVASSPHASHPHVLYRASRYETGQTHVACSHCRSVVVLDPIGSVYWCSECRFYLCCRCFEIEEAPFDNAQYVVCNPLHEVPSHSAVVRMWPDKSSREMCYIQPGELRHVVSETTSNDGIRYFRQQCGGWIQADDVVCVYPTGSPISSVVATHLQLDYHGSADLLPRDAFSQCIEHSMQLLESGPAFGAVMSLFSLLPVQLYITSPDFVNDTDSAEACFRLCSATLQFAVSGLEQIGASANWLAAALPVRIAGRSLSVMWHMHQRLPDATARFADTMPLVVHVADLLAEFVSASNVRFTGEESNDPLETLWHILVTQNESSERAAAQVLCLAVSLCELCMYLIAEIPSSRDQLSGLNHVMHLVEQLPDQCDSLTFHLLRALHRVFVRANRPISALQQQLFNADVVELAIGKHIRQRDPPGMIAACDILCDTFHHNLSLINMAREIVLPKLVESAQVSPKVDQINSVFAVLTVFTYFPPNPQEDETQRCTAAVAGGSPTLQELVIFNVPQCGPVGLCSFCAKTHPPMKATRITNTAEGVFDTRCYAVCQCGHCTTDYMPQRRLSCTASIAQASMMKHRALPLLLCKLRTHRLDVLNAVARFASRWVYTSEELTLDVLETLLPIPPDDLCDRFWEPAMFVAARQHQYSRVREVLEAHEGSGISQYARCRSTTACSDESLSPQQHANESAPGLSPSRSTLEGSIAHVTSCLDDSHANVFEYTQ